MDEILAKQNLKKEKMIMSNATTITMLSSPPIDAAIKAIKTYHGTIATHTRYRSWEHCYEAFHKYWRNPAMTDYLCLHLAFYLASWGMYRGSAFLLDYDYLVHRPVVRKLTNIKYAGLFLNPYDNTSIGSTIEAAKDIIGAYGENPPTDKLITKILLGVFGTSPAYDICVKTSCEKYSDFTGYAKIDPSKNMFDYLNGMWAYYEKNISHFASLPTAIYTTYTPMKLLDMCLWQLGTIVWVKKLFTKKKSLPLSQKEIFDQFPGIPDPDIEEVLNGLVSTGYIVKSISDGITKYQKSKQPPKRGDGDSLVSIV
jgi:hypothetical protein